MPENDEARVIATRLLGNWYDSYGESEEGCPRASDDVCRLAYAYLAHPPLTRERVEKAVGELCDSGDVKPFSRTFLTDRLCRLLGVPEGE